MTTRALLIALLAITVPSLLLAETKLEAIYGNGPGAYERCVEANIKAEQEAKKNQPVIDHSWVYDYCDELAKQEVEVEINDPYFNRSQQPLLATTQTILDLYGLTARDLISFYTSPDYRFLVIGATGSAMVTATSLLLTRRQSVRLASPVRAGLLAGMATTLGSGTIAFEVRADRLKIDFASAHTRLKELASSHSFNRSEIEALAEQFSPQEIFELAKTAKEARDALQIRAIEECNLNPLCRET